MAYNVHSIIRNARIMSPIARICPVLYVRVSGTRSCFVQDAILGTNYQANDSSIRVSRSSRQAVT